MILIKSYKFWLKPYGFYDLIKNELKPTSIEYEEKIKTAVSLESGFIF